MKKVTTVDAYIDAFPKDVQGILQTLRKTIKEEIPDADEVISYGIPCFKLNGKYVVYFSGYKKHVSLYPASDEMEKLLPELSRHRIGKGTLQFPLDQPLPLPLIRKIVRFLIKENNERAKTY